MNSHTTTQVPPKMPLPHRVTRPWGSFSQYAGNEAVTVTMMTVEPGQRLSLQSHIERAELWVVIDPGAIVEIDDVLHYPEPGAELWIPARARHRLSSDGRLVRVLEIAFGNWQQEDITRYADDYGRPEQGE